MTNAQIILKESESLVEQGILGMVNVMGAPMPEPIHTFQAWKELGYKVKKGEKAIAKFPIWKHSSKTEVDEATKEEKQKTSMFMKTAAFFKKSQVERIEESEGVAQ